MKCRQRDLLIIGIVLIALLTGCTGTGKQLGAEKQVKPRKITKTMIASV
ncbi:hypothetical protein ACLIBH_10480 [Virgibacillus sp. W0430]